MARTKRNVPYKHYWGSTKNETKRYWEERKAESGWDTRWGRYYVTSLERDYLLHGTDAKNFCYPTHEYFNRVNRVGRRVCRDQLRPHIVLGEDYEFDDSHYVARYKGVWWDIY